MSEHEFKTMQTQWPQLISQAQKTCKNSTALSKHTWKLKDAGKEFTIKWSINCETCKGLQSWLKKLILFMLDWEDVHFKFPGQKEPIKQKK